MKFWSRKATSSLLLSGAAGVPMAAEFVQKSPQVALAAGSIGLLATLIGNQLLGERQDSRLAMTVRSHFLEEACLKAYEAIRAADPSARLNVMLLKWSPWPLTRLLEGRFHFHTKFGMENHPDENIPLYGSQGVAGEAVKSKCWAASGIGPTTTLYIGNYGTPKPHRQEGPVEFGLDAKQLAATSALKTIYSYPFHRMKQGKDDPKPVQTPSVLGVVNLDSQLTYDQYGTMTLQYSDKTQLSLHDALLTQLLPSVAYVSSLLFS